jgi:PPOX class probable FMN-dependent enzyme
MTAIDDRDALRDRYPPALVRSLQKQIDHVDRHCRRFIELSPFFVLASAGSDGTADASPRGGPPGFVLVEDAHTLLVPDWPGNNRLDSFTNLVSAPGVGLLFLVPGVDETLRVNGTATVSDDEALRARFAADGRGVPRTVLVVAVHEAYLHCAKALMRSRLWDPDAHVPRSSLPTMGEMMRDHTGSNEEPESQEEMVERYRTILYTETGGAQAPPAEGSAR